ncbi:MAG: hypothetical protein B6245_14660 [Desulfobacteraceae bacterium 4572_88]|nr:MAG: hypothetical protein B6245_14660 [Desulfobacteraceae bacterium 4572_88]
MMTDETKYKAEGKEIQGIVQIEKADSVTQVFKEKTADPDKQPKKPDSKPDKPLWFSLVVLYTIVITSLLLTKVLCGDRFFSVAKSKDFWQIALSGLVPSLICIAFVLSLSAAYRNISKGLIFIVLIPLCSMITSVMSASLLVERPIREIARELFSITEDATQDDSVQEKSDPKVLLPPKDASAITESPVPNDADKLGKSSETRKGQQSETADKPGLSEPSLPSSGSKKDVFSDSKQPREDKVQRVAVRDPDSANDLGMEFVHIPPGTFMMGSPEDEQGRYNDERQHQVTLTRGFHMQTTEMTQRQWKAKSVLL